jgi:SAM-dependent methyltransferase
MHDAASCFLCGSERGEPIFREGEYLAKQCGCGLVSLDPTPGPQDPTIDHHARIYYSAPAAKRVRWLQRFVPQGRVLDIGCGEGEFAAAAIALGFQVDGLDPSTRRAEIAERVTGITVQRALIEEAELPARAYDGIFHVDLLSHFPEPLESLRRMHACLKPGGVMCFEVGLFGGLGARWRGFAGRGNFPAHRWLFSEGAVRRLLETAGFDVVGIKLHAVGPSTFVTSVGLMLFRPRQLREDTALHRPIVPGRLGNLYYRAQMWMRYDLGARLRIGGPQVAFFAAKPRG